jgi:predicted metallopeptidase
MDYEKATPDMIDIAEQIVTKHHQRLDGVNIAILTQEKASKSKGRTVYGTASTIPAKMIPLLAGDYHFVIVIAMDQWAALSDAQKRALMDHEICHCTLTENGPAIRGHDYEEFAEIIARHGFWREDHGEQTIQEALIHQGVKIGTLK